LAERAYHRGSVVLVPFPFTDLSGRKRRPALVVSPDGFHEEDLILCVITSRVPDNLADHEVLLEPTDMLTGDCPKGAW
jgi:mRNA interferase MazF